jgi:hypothetical protein
MAIFVCLLLCIRLVGGFNGNADKTLCWSAVCAASVRGRETRDRGLVGGLVRERGVPRGDAVFRSSVWGSLVLLVEVQGSESRVSLAVCGDLV